MKKTLISIIIFSLLIVIANPIFAAETQKTNQELSNFSVWNVVLVGMFIIFFSLVVIAFAVDLLKHLQKRKKKSKFVEQKKIISEKISHLKPLHHKEKATPLHHNVQLAILTTLFLYENEIENQSKMLLTMKRAKTCTWKQSSRLLMPNSCFNRKF